jgi:hypothetical protein
LCIYISNVRLTSGRGRWKSWRGSRKSERGSCRCRRDNCWSKLDDITLCRELEVLSTRETSLEHREADLKREWKALEDAHAQILACELDADSRETGLRDQEARLVARER